MKLQTNSNRTSVPLLQRQHKVDRKEAKRLYDEMMEKRWVKIKGKKIGKEKVNISKRHYLHLVQHNRDYQTL